MKRRMMNEKVDEIEINQNFAERSDKAKAGDKAPASYYKLLQRIIKR